MADEASRQLERDAAQGDLDALDRLRRSWLRQQVLHQCPDCGGLVHEDVFEEHRLDAHRSRGARENSARAPDTRIVPVPPGLPGAAKRPKKEPLYFRSVLRPGDFGVQFFHQTGNMPIWDTNMPGTGGYLPTGYDMLVWGISLTPDARADPQDVLKVWDSSALTLSVGNDPLFWRTCSKLLMDDQPRVSDEVHEEALMVPAWEDAEEPTLNLRARRLRCRGLVRNLTIGNQPLSIAQLVALGAHLEVDQGVSSSLSRPVGLTLALFGIMLKALSG